jgi:hypothetical protein
MYGIRYIDGFVTLASSTNHIHLRVILWECLPVIGFSVIANLFIKGTELLLLLLLLGYFV